MAQILILDGGLGTTLELNHDVQFTPSQPLWSSHLLLSDPSTLLSCQRSFALVPVDILLTATYQMSVEGLAHTKTPDFPNGIRGTDSILPVLEAAVDLAHQAVRDTGFPEPKLALSLGPYGACMVPSTEYTGRYDTQHDDLASLTDWHAERMQLFAQLRDPKARVGFVAIETVPRGDEIAAARTALGSVPELAGIPFWISCLYPEELALPDGTSPENVVRATLDPRKGGPVPWGIGINCTKVDKLDALVRRFEGEVARMQGEGLVSAWPALVLYPDGTNGEVYNTQTKAWEAPPPSGPRHARIPWEKQLAAVVQAAVSRGKWPAIVAGGCCMSRPADIARLRGLLLPTP
ncbi:Homocysteine S-methyltransferase YbgG [Escovopsis weberi]|uniref:Homocysteine S-methyltransferase YbgG n=1 Tax=Escovopsis weberi TaxID=150374 RepID=A0A0M8N6B6_ESCWE|nr:Homocysteine S-methyltransferase YbgG [Escovopsis weberi]